MNAITFVLEAIQLVVPFMLFIKGRCFDKSKAKVADEDTAMADIEANDSDNSIEMVQGELSVESNNSNQEEENNSRLLDLNNPRPQTNNANLLVMH